MTYNILLFGESGAGKSTTINALANYLQYASFEDAMASGEFTQKIPSKITLLHPDTYEDLVIQHGGDDPNELHNDDGASITQSAKSYFLTLGDKQFRIIDTPGMGDTRGIEVDKKNFQSIMEHLKDFDQLHAICFLIKTNTTRKTAFFAYCLNQLLTTLHRDACANIIFCFTFSRNSLYGPGDGYQTLKGFFKTNEFNSQTIELKTGVNCFYIDNEAFRFLLAKKYKYPFKENHEAEYRESWDKSVAHAFKMLNLIPTFPPHNLNETFTIIKARKWIAKLSSKFQEIENNKENFDKFQNEYSQLEDFIFKLAEYVTLYSNVITEKLIEPYLDLLIRKINQLTNDAEQTKSPTMKRRKFSSNTISNENLYLNSEQKLKIFNDFIKAENRTNFVTTDEIVELAQQMTTLKHLGDYFVKELGIERVAVEKGENIDEINSNSTESSDTEFVDSHSQIQNGIKSDSNSINSNEQDFEPPIVNSEIFKENSSEIVLELKNFDSNNENRNNSIENTQEFVLSPENESQMLAKSPTDSDLDYYLVNNHLSDSYSESDSFKSTAASFTNNKFTEESVVIDIEDDPKLPNSSEKLNFTPPVPSPRKSTSNPNINKEFSSKQIDDIDDVQAKSKIKQTSDVKIDMHFGSRDLENSSFRNLSVENLIYESSTSLRAPSPLAISQFSGFLAPLKVDSEMTNSENSLIESENLNQTITNSDDSEEEIQTLSNHVSKFDKRYSDSESFDSINSNNQFQNGYSNQTSVDLFQNDHKSELDIFVPESQILAKPVEKFHEEEEVDSQQINTEQLNFSSDSDKISIDSSEHFSAKNSTETLSHPNSEFLNSRFTSNSVDDNSNSQTNSNFISSEYDYNNNAYSKPKNSQTEKKLGYSLNEIKKENGYIGTEIVKNPDQNDYKPFLPVNGTKNQTGQYTKQQTNVIATRSASVRSAKISEPNDYRRSSENIGQTKQQTTTTVKVSPEINLRNHPFGTSNSVDYLQNSNNQIENVNVNRDIEANFDETPSNNIITESENQIENIVHENPEEAFPPLQETEIKPEKKKAKFYQGFTCWKRLPDDDDTRSRETNDQNSKKKCILLRRPKWLKDWMDERDRKKTNKRQQQTYDVIE